MPSQIEPRTGGVEPPSMKGAMVRAPVARAAAARVQRTTPREKPVRAAFTPIRKTGTMTPRY